MSQDSGTDVSGSDDADETSGGGLDWTRRNVLKVSGIGAGLPPDSSMNSLYSRISSEFSALSTEKVSVEHTQGQHVVLRLKSEYLFEHGSSRLRDNLMVLEKISSILNMVKNEVQIRGHAYPEPSVPNSNAWKLSAQRAGRIAEYFVEGQNIAPERFSILALADTSPISPGKDMRAKDENSRIEVRILGPTVSSRK